MVYAVFKVSKENVGSAKRILNDDLLSRQSMTMRDAGSIGLEGDVVYVMLEGSEEAIKRAGELFGAEKVADLLDAAEGDKIYNTIKEEEDNSVAAMGAIFG